MRPLAFVDLETTGATATTDRITEIGIVTVDADGRVEEWQQLVNPETRIPPFIEQLTGISDALVAGAPPFAEIANEVLSRLEGRLFIAHNARFDYGFLQNAFKRLGLPFRAPMLCTVKLSRTLFPEHKRHNLDSLAERHGLLVDGRHRALADARLIHQFWQRIHEFPGPAAVAAAIDRIEPRPTLPAGLDAAAVEDLPDTPGVYLFYGENALPLYIGKAKNLRRRVLAHFAADHASAREMALAQQVRRVDWQETAGEIESLLREAALVKSLSPSHNRQLRASEEVCSWTLEDAGEGWLRPRLLGAGELDFSQPLACYGLFKHAREARKALSALADKHQLCTRLLGLDPASPGKPCFGHPLGKCRGACVGKEAPTRHSLRLVSALTGLKLLAWPFPGPALLREGERVHVIDGWRHLGSARVDEEIHAHLEAPRAPFDPDIYRILAARVTLLKPLPRRPQDPVDRHET